MDRQQVVKMFARIGSRLTIRTGTVQTDGLVSLNVANDRKGEHFTLTVNPILKDEQIEINAVDVDTDLKQMLLVISGPRLIWDRRSNPSRPIVRYEYSDPNRNRRTERLLCGHDEMHWFVAGVSSANSIRQAFSFLRPQAVTRVMFQRGVKTKDWKKRKTKGYIRQGEWFFVPVDYTSTKDDIIHKNEPISRAGGKPHMVSEIIRTGGRVVYVNPSGAVITLKQFEAMPHNQRMGWTQRVAEARVLARGKVTHPDHHVVELKTWHEVHLSRENTGRRISGGLSANAFID